MVKPISTVTTSHQLNTRCLASLMLLGTGQSSVWRDTLSGITLSNVLAIQCPFGWRTRELAHLLRTPKMVEMQQTWSRFKRPWLSGLTRRHLYVYMFSLMITSRSTTQTQSLFQQINGSISKSKLMTRTVWPWWHSMSNQSFFRPCTTAFT